MRRRQKNWLTVQRAAAIMDTTSAEVCPELSVGRLSGSKWKQPGRPGKAQWLVDPKSVTKEQRRATKRVTQIARRRKRRAARR